jgi:hypothetical protein
MINVPILLERMAANRSCDSQQLCTLSFSVLHEHAQLSRECHPVNTFCDLQEQRHIGFVQVLFSPQRTRGLEAIFARRDPHPGRIVDLGEV